MNILIADDEEYAREELLEVLERTIPEVKFNTFFAEDHDSALKVISENSVDIAFLDIQMPGKNGLALAENIKKASPKTNIVMVTAYSQYALDALKLFVSGYLIKPVMDKDLKDVLDNLRNPISETERHLDVHCFGNFEIFSNGKPITFKRTKEKELLAYLICLKGASATRGEICSTVFEESDDLDKKYTYFRTIVSALKKDLNKYGFEELLIQNPNSYAVDISLLRCDYYDYLTGKAEEERSYKGEFMNQYEWAEEYIYSLENY